MHLSKATIFASSLAWVTAQPFAGGLYRRQNDTNYNWGPWDKSSVALEQQGSGSTSVVSTTPVVSTVAITPVEAVTASSSTTVPSPTSSPPSSTIVIATTPTYSDTWDMGFPTSSTSVVTSTSSNASSSSVLATKATTTTTASISASSIPKSSSTTNTATQEAFWPAWNSSSSSTGVLATSGAVGEDLVVNSTSPVATTTATAISTSTYDETRTITSGWGDSTSVITTTLHLTSTITRTITFTVPASQTTGAAGPSAPAAEPTTTVRSTSTFWITVTLYPAGASPSVVDGTNRASNPTADASTIAQPTGTGNVQNNAPAPSPGTPVENVIPNNHPAETSGPAASAQPTSAINNSSPGGAPVGQNLGGCSMSVVTTTVVIHSTVTVTPGLPTIPTAVQPLYPMGNGTHHSRGTASSGFLTLRSTSKSMAPLTTGSSW